MKASIPVANIYYLLCYAWNEFAPRQIELRASENFPDTLHLFSRQLIIGIQALHRRGLETGYLPIEEITSCPRGRILMASSIRTITAQPKKLHCSVEEMSVDIRNNQILRTTLNRLLTVKELDTSVRRELRQALSLLLGVRGVELDGRIFRSITLHQGNRLYSFLLTICRFLYECMAAKDQAGNYRFREVHRDEKRMRRVFEKFVLNFFARRQTTFNSVKSERMDWCATALNGLDQQYLPIMSTDVSLRSGNRTVIVECKYTKKLFQSRFGAERLRSLHLYQLCSYLRNLEHNGGADRNAEGILLYPTAGRSLDLNFRIHDHLVRVCTLDLSQTWTAIEDQMLSLIRSGQDR